MSILRCLNEPLNIIGNWESQIANVPQIYWEKCDLFRRDTCKTDAEVKEWMKNKYFWLVFNKKLIQNDEFGEATFIERAFMNRVPLDIDSALMSRFDVRIENFDSNDNYWSLTGRNEESLYNFYKKNDFKYYWNKRSINGIVIGMDDNVLYTKRSIYTTAMFFSNVGGFVFAVTTLIALLLPLFVDRAGESAMI